MDQKFVQAWEEWQKEYPAGSERESEFVTNSGIPVHPLYTPADLEGTDYLEDIGFPGVPPFTRGIHRTMYRGRPWTIRQLAGYGTAADTNARFRFLLEKGATGLNCVFDYPTLRGYDSDAPEAEGDVGQGGVAVDTVEDMAVLFRDIPLDRVSVSLVACNPVMSLTIMAMYLVVAWERGISWDSLAGTVQNDFLMETAITMAPAVLPPAASFKLSTDVVEFCTLHVPRWNPISYTGYNYREAGVDAIQEVAIVLANALATVEEMVRRGYVVDRFVPRLSFFFSADSDFFEEIAKYRAARRLWCKLMRERYGADNPRTLALRYHVQTAGWTLTAQEPLNNVVRAAYQALAAVLGGAQSLHVDGYDEALCIPTEQAALLALRTQQILREETNVANTIDPLGGSYYVEYLTNELERRIREYLGRIEAQGGIVATVANGWLHGEIMSSSYRTQKDIEAGRRRIVGVNCYPAGEQKVEIFRPNPATRSAQLERLAEVRRTRDAARVAEALAGVRRACEAGANAMSAIVEAVAARATVGEIAGVLREVYGTWRLPLY